MHMLLSKRLTNPPRQQKSDATVWKDSCPTRWSSTFLMTERLIAVWVPLSQVLEYQGWNNLTTSEWKVMHWIRETCPNHLCSTHHWWVGKTALPYWYLCRTVMKLNLYLEKMKNIPEVSIATNAPLTESKRQFRKYMDLGDVDHDPIFLMCALVDPQ